MDSQGAHKHARVRQLLEQRGAPSRFCRRIRTI